jgi:hypothetical protein
LLSHVCLALSSLFPSGLTNKIFYDIAPCRVVEVYLRFRGACCLYRQSDESWWSSPWWWGQQASLKCLPYCTAQHPILAAVRTWNLNILYFSSPYACYMSRPISSS